MPVDGPQYPVLLDLRGRPCLVVGGGRVALGKVRGLLAVDADVTVVAPDVDEELAGLEAVTVVRRPYEPGDLDGKRLVLTATDDADVNRRVFVDAEARGIWV